MDILEIITESVMDTAKLLPFLFITYVLLELLEHRAQDGTVAMIRKSGRLGPLYGGLLGLIPLCGFSSAAANFYAGSVISMGTLLSVMLATSDEMLPVLLSGGAAPVEIARILVIKGALGIAFGFAVDLIHLRRDKSLTIGSLCEEAHGDDPEAGVIKASVIHTVKIGAFILAVNLLLGFVFEVFGEDAVGAVLGGPGKILLAALFGLIPNCGISVILTHLYLLGSLPFSAMMAGLLTNGGVGLAVCFRLIKRRGRKLQIVILLLICGILGGIVCSAL